MTTVNSPIFRVLLPSLALSLAACGQPDSLEQAKTQAREQVEQAQEQMQSSAEASGDALSHARLHATVRLQLLENLGADGMDIDIDVDGGDVVLKGATSREAAKLAPTLVRQVDGVTHVKSELELSDDADRGASAAGAGLDDAVTNAGIGLKLLDAVGTHALKIKVKVAGDTAVLSGTVPSEEVRADALAAAREQEGISSVMDELVVK